MGREREKQLKLTGAFGVGGNGVGGGANKTTIHFRKKKRK